MYYKVGEYIIISVVLVPMSDVILNLCQMPFLIDFNVMLQLQFRIIGHGFTYSEAIRNYRGLM